MVAATFSYFLFVALFKTKLATLCKVISSDGKYAKQANNDLQCLRNRMIFLNIWMTSDLYICIFYPQRYTSASAA